MAIYKMIIADDESMIRKGLVNSVDWENLGFQVVADVMDGQDIIDYLQENDVDVVFTDVLMCQVTGLEAARWVREHKPQIKVVMISGYKEFEYIREAMEYKVCHYVLKPIDISELEEVFGKVRKELDKTRMSKDMHVGVLLDGYEDEALVKVYKKQEMAIESVLRGSKEQLRPILAGWKLAVGNANPEYMSLLAIRYINGLFEGLEGAGISLDGEFEKKSVFDTVRNLTAAQMIEYTVQLSLDIVDSIEKKKSTSSRDVITRAKEYIDLHLAQELGVEEIASYMYLNRSYFSREFKSRVGISVMDYIIQRRMEKAVELLKAGNFSTKKIAELVGYEDVKYFQRAFKKYTGYTVREYRNLLR